MTRYHAPAIFFKNLSAGEYSNAAVSISALALGNGYSMTGTAVEALRCLDLANPNAKNLAEFLATFVRDFFTDAAGIPGSAAAGLNEDQEPGGQAD